MLKGWRSDFSVRCRKRQLAPNSNFATWPRIEQFLYESWNYLTSKWKKNMINTVKTWWQMGGETTFKPISICLFSSNPAVINSEHLRHRLARQRANSQPVCSPGRRQSVTLLPSSAFRNYFHPYFPFHSMPFRFPCPSNFLCWYYCPADCSLIYIHRNMNALWLFFPLIFGGVLFHRSN